MTPQAPRIAERSTGRTTGQHAEDRVRQRGVAREEQDAFAILSHERAHAARTPSTSSGSATLGVPRLLERNGLGVDDVDVYAVPVTAGQRLIVDLEAKELGSTLDAIIELFDDSDTLVTIVDDAVDPHSGAFSEDPAMDLIVDFTGTAKVRVTSPGCIGSVLIRGSRPTTPAISSMRSRSVTGREPPRLKMRKRPASSAVSSTSRHAARTPATMSSMNV